MHEEDKEVRGLSQVAKYTITAILLGVLTSIEVLVLYPPLAYAADSVKIALLAGLAFLKFVVVVALFMHLWHDSPLFTGIFTLGMIIGAGTLVGLLALFSYYPPPENAVKPPSLQQIYEERRQKHSEGADYDDHAYLVPPPMSVVTTS